MPRSPLVVKNGSRQRLLRGFAHADAVVLELDDHVVVARVEPGVQGDRAAVGQGVHGIEQQVGERVTHLVLRAEDLRHIGSELGFDVDDDAALLRHVAPARAREIHDLEQDLVHVHRSERQLEAAR